MNRTIIYYDQHGNQIGYSKPASVLPGVLIFAFIALFVVPLFTRGCATTVPLAQPHLAARHHHRMTADQALRASDPTGALSRHDDIDTPER
jgi:hypothetical protein